SRDVVTMRLQRVRDDAHSLIGQQVLSSDLHHAGRSASARSEDRREVEIVRDNDELVLVRPREDVMVWCGHRPYGGPVDGLEPVPRKPVDPAWREAYPRAASRLAQWNFDFLGAPGGIGEGFSDVLGFEVGILSENLVARTSCRDEADDCA